MPITFYKQSFELLATSGEWTGTSAPANKGVIGTTFPYRKYLHVEGTIAGGTFNRLRVAKLNATPVTATCGANIIETVLTTTTSNTTVVSTSGWPLNLATSATPKYFVFDIYNPTTSIKRCTGLVTHTSNVASTAPGSARIAGVYDDVTGGIQFLDLASVTTLAGNTANNLSGSVVSTTTSGPLELYVWGKADF
ncbi:hypothetical protein UFOVP1246_52 [uncultured Caudovirales phage]|uniref:Uncharacterized protein n=1 Tax=uncultured Caudovirales phage TaxID=2100421 RepID=A0A6J5RBI2_9CAUD|nr:hypothetical protein UFOVP1246_52 [uncultured Caudovirales phage]